MYAIRSYYAQAASGALARAHHADASLYASRITSYNVCYTKLLRHGETEWSLNGRHTGLSDIDLTENGRNEAREAGKRLAGIKFDHVLTSPLKRARETCELAGYGAGAQTTDELTEWNYGEYEGITTVEIQQTRPEWWLFSVV